MSGRQANHQSYLDFIRDKIVALPPLGFPIAAANAAAARILGERTD